MRNVLAEVHRRRNLQYNVGRPLRSQSIGQLQTRGITGRAGLASETCCRSGHTPGAFKRLFKDFKHSVCRSTRGWQRHPAGRTTQLQRTYSTSRSTPGNSATRLRLKTTATAALTLTRTTTRPTASGGGYCSSRALNTVTALTTLWCWGKSRSSRARCATCHARTCMRTCRLQPHPARSFWSIRLTDAYPLCVISTIV